MPENSPEEAAESAPKTPVADAGASEKPSSSWLVPIVTAVVLVSIFCVFYFVYVASRREYLENRNFRALAALGDQLQTMITIHSSILEFYADLSTKQRHRTEVDRKPVPPEEILVVRPEDQSLPKAARDREVRKDYINFLAPMFELANPTEGKSPAPPERLHTQRREGRWVLELAAIQHKNDATDFKGALVIDDLFRTMVGSQPFDDILLAADDDIVYQEKRNGPQFTTLAALLETQTGTAESKAPKGEEKKAPSPKTPSSATHLTDIMITGTRYKLFLQPVWIDVFSDDPKVREKPRQWMLCGLTSTRSLEWEALAISYSFIIWLIVLFLAIWMGGPFLKLFFINHRERLRLRELLIVGICLLLLSSVFTLSGLQAAYFHSNDDNTEARLEKLSEDLGNNIHQELSLMRQQLLALCRLPALQQDLQKAKDIESVRRRIADPSSGAEIATAANLYPNLGNAFWTDDDGHQVVKWSAADFVTPLIDISSLRAYAQPRSTYLDNQGPPLHVDSVLPPNRLEYLAAMAIATEQCVPEDKQDGIRGDISGGAAILTAQPFSLIDPALPLGYGFALLDPTGLVLFHSDKTRNLRENFAQESDWNRELAAAAFGHSTQRSLHMKYLGRDYRARVAPVPGVSQAQWSLIVYRDLTPVRTLDLEAMSMATTLLMLILAGPFFGMAIWCLINRPNFAPEWAWPNPARMGTYTYQIATYSLLIVLFLFLGFRESPEEVLIASAAVPYTALLLTLWCFRIYPERAGKDVKTGGGVLLPAALSCLVAFILVAVLAYQWKEMKDLSLLLAGVAIAAVPLVGGPREFVMRRFHYGRRSGVAGSQGTGERKLGPLGYRNCYLLSVLLLVLLIGVLTPMALFRASLGVERRLQMKQAQLHLASVLEQHQREIEDQHSKGERAESAYREFYRDPAEWKKMGLTPLFAADGLPSIKPHEDAARGELYRDWFQGLVYSLHHDYNDSAAEMLGVIPDRGDPVKGGQIPDWTWQNHGSKVTLRWHGAHSHGADQPAEEKDIVIESVVPGFSGRDTWLALGIALIVMLIMGLLLWTLAQKVFLFHVDPLKITGKRQLAEALRQGKNVLVLVPPVSRWKLEEPKFTLEVPKLANGPKWAEQMNLDEVPTNALIEIAQFEHTTGDPEIDNQSVLLVRRLIQRKGTQVAAVMTVNASPEDYRRKFPELEVIDLREEPFPWLAAYEGPARDLIWKECGPLPALWPIGAQLAKDIRHETIHSEDTIASEILERADAYYRLMWRECSPDQKFVLAQLAEDGLLNPANGRAVHQMVRRGLITKDPQFRIVNESFRRFLRAAAPREMRRQWLNESRSSGWGKAHGAFFTTLLIVGAFLLTTQNQLWQSSAAYVTGAFGALGTLTKLFNTVRSGATGEKPS